MPMTDAEKDRLLLVTANGLRTLLFLAENGGFGDLPSDTGNEIVNIRARLDNALGSNTEVGK